MKKSTEMLRSAHPVDDAMRAQIMAALADIERQHDAAVLFACESGSRGWGFAWPDSDDDVRFIDVNRLSWYLTVAPQRDVIELPIGALSAVPGRPEQAGASSGAWGPAAGCQRLGAAQGAGPDARIEPHAARMARSPLGYREEAALMADFRALAQQVFVRLRGWHHYTSMAKKTFREHLQAESVRFKKYLYMLRPLLAARWIEANEGVPPMRFAELAHHVLDATRDAALLAEIDALLEVKMRASEAATSPRWPGIHAFIESELARLASAAPQAAPPRHAGAALDDHLRQTVLRFDTASLPGGHD